MFNKKMISVFAAGVMALSLTACGSQSSASTADSASSAASSSISGTVTASGSSALLPLVQAAADDYMEANPNVSVTTNGGGSGTGLKQVADGSVDIGDSDVFAAEKLDATTAASLTDHEVATITMAAVANKSLGVTNLTTQQLTDIFTAKITNWKEVGGEDLKIQVINRDEASGTREAFRTIVMDGTPFDRRSAVLSGTGQVRDVVSRSRGAIGYISLGFVDSLNAKTSVKAVSVNHVEASEKTVASGGYPISRDLYFFVKGAPSQQAQDYIDYVTSEKMDKQIREAGFIPVTNDEKGSE